MTRAVRNTLIGIGVFGIIGVIALVVIIKAVLASGITRAPDNIFGDQHLKTAVALIELHKVRNGEYPASLKDLKFTGQWDQLALQSVKYYTNPDKTSYFVEVQRGWVGKPDLNMPAQFWSGTGFRPELKPKRKDKEPEK